VYEDKRLKKRGLACTSMTKEDLILLVRRLGQSAILKENKNTPTICEQIEKYLIKKHIENLSKGVVYFSLIGKPGSL
jgi:hypothetical protein